MHGGAEESCCVSKVTAGISISGHCRSLPE